MNIKEGLFRSVVMVDGNWVDGVNNIWTPLTWDIIFFIPYLYALIFTLGGLIKNKKQR